MVIAEDHGGEGSSDRLAGAPESRDVPVVKLALDSDLPDMGVHHGDAKYGFFVLNRLLQFGDVQLRRQLSILTQFVQLFLLPPAIL